MAGLSIREKRSLVNETSKWGSDLFVLNLTVGITVFLPQHTCTQRSLTAKIKLCICVVRHCYNHESRNALNSIVHKVP